MPLQPHAPGAWTALLVDAATGVQALPARRRLKSHSPIAATNAEATPNTAAMYSRLEAKRSQSRPITPATDKPEMMGTSSGTAQHAAHAPASPMVVRRGLFIAIPFRDQFR